MSSSSWKRFDGESAEVSREVETVELPKTDMPGKQPDLRGISENPGVSISMQKDRTALGLADGGVRQLFVLLIILHVGIV